MINFHKNKLMDQAEKVLYFTIILVSIGGSLALFLGFSFMSGVELIYFVIEYFIETIIKSIKRI
jgi:hypothetical protein